MSEKVIDVKSEKMEPIVVRKRNNEPLTCQPGQPQNSNLNQTINPEALLQNPTLIPTIFNFKVKYVCEITSQGGRLSSEYFQAWDQFMAIDIVARTITLCSGNSAVKTIQNAHHPRFLSIKCFTCEPRLDLSRGDVIYEIKFSKKSEAMDLALIYWMATYFKEQYNFMRNYFFGMNIAISAT